MKQKILITSVLVIVAITGLIGMQYSSSHTYTGSQGFNRRSANVLIRLMGRVKVPSPFRDICGFTDTYVYFSSSDPTMLFRMNLQSRNFDSISLKMQADNRLRTNFTIAVDSPYVFTYAGNCKQILRYNFNDESVAKISLKRNYNKAINLSSGSFVVRSFDSTASNKILTKQNEAGYFLEAVQLLDRPNDGGLLTDGTLNYDRENKLLLFTHYYINKIICLDTNLNLRYAMRSIDSCNHYQATIVKKEGVSRRGYTFSSPPHLVNYVSCCSNGNLYINSRIKADNESMDMYRENSIIDIYNVLRKAYLGSFYLPNFDNKRISDFKVLPGGYVVALYKTEVGVYRISPTINRP